MKRVKVPKRIRVETPRCYLPNPHLAEAPLTPYERWMVKSNLRRIAEREIKAGALVQLLRVRGYHRVANEVDRQVGGAK